MRLRPWLVPPRGTPTRDQFEVLFHKAGLPLPDSITEAGSVIIMREMVGNGHHLDRITKAQAAREIERGMVAELRFSGLPLPRPIRLTLRSGWQSTRAQQAMPNAIRAAV